MATNFGCICNLISRRQEGIFRFTSQEVYLRLQGVSLITTVAMSLETLFNLRAFGYDWKSSLQLLDSYFRRWPVPVTCST